MFLYHLVYKSPAYEELQFSLCIEKLIKQGYPEVSYTQIKKNIWALFGTYIPY